jgi:hypothetical protein
MPIHVPCTGQNLLESSRSLLLSSKLYLSLQRVKNDLSFEIPLGFLYIVGVCTRSCQNLIGLASDSNSYMKNEK